MPLYLRPPRKATHSYQIRGTYLGVAVERSADTHKRSVALSELRKLERAIEAGEYPAKAPARHEGPTFLSAAVSYMQHGGERRYMKPLIAHFGETPLPIAQEAIDEAAIAICPNTTPATRSRQVYAPVSAVMHHALGDKCPPIRHPKGSKGKVRTDWLSEDDANAILRAADADLRLLLTFLLYTGCRLGEALRLTWGDIDFDKRLAWIGKTKNGDPRTVLLRADLCEALRQWGGRSEGTNGRARPEGAAEEVETRAAGSPTAIFPFRQGGHLKWQLRRATLKACGIDAPARRPDDYEVPKHRLGWVNFHSCRHTFASWFRRSGGDVQGLVATGNWRDLRSASRYAHVVARDEWQRVERMPKVGT